MIIEQAIQNLTEIVELSDEEINNNNENASAILDLEDIKSLKVVLKELKKKDKIIDEMAGYIATLDIEEDICSKTKNEHCDKMNFGECEDCIKQYFEKKVEE